MSLWWVVNKDTKEMIYSCDDAGKDACSIGADQCWLEAPEGVALGNCKVQVDMVEDEEVLSLVDGSLDKIGPMWDAMRAARNEKLTACDWTQLADSPLGAPAQAEWATYRQALRDLPENTLDPANPEWPTVPGEE